MVPAMVKGVVGPREASVPGRGTRRAPEPRRRSGSVGGPPGPHAPSPGPSLSAATGRGRSCRWPDLGGVLSGVQQDAQGPRGPSGRPESSGGTCPWECSVPKVAGGGEGPSRRPAPHIASGPQRPWAWWLRGGGGAGHQVITAHGQCALETELLGTVLFNFLNIVFEIKKKNNRAAPVHGDRYV